MKRFFTTLLVLATILAMTFILAGCGDNTHPFAIRLKEILNEAEDDVFAFLVDIDGNETKGMLIVYGDAETAVIYQFYRGELRDGSFDVVDRWNGVPGRVRENNRLVIYYEIDDTYGYRFYGSEGGALWPKLQIYVTPCFEEDGIGIAYKYQFMGNEHQMSYERYKEVREEYGLNDIEFWHEMQTEERDEILSLVR